MFRSTSFRSGLTVTKGAHMHLAIGRLLSLATLLLISITASAQTDPLPSWNDSPAKQAIVKFVGSATRDGAPEYIAPADRIATFDNDGTLWSEQPFYFQLAFALDRVKAIAPQHPEWKDKEPFKSLLAGDVKAALAGGEKSVLAIIAATHSGMTTDEFNKTVVDWSTTARHPKTKKLYTEMVYQPMLEVLTYLRANGFKTFIVSGGGIEFMRPWTQRVYGIPPEQVVGSQGKLKFDLRNGKPVLVKLPEVDFIDDGPGKPAGIAYHIGKQPVIAFGNSDGDLQMLQWTTGRGKGNLGFIVHHTDAVREWAYDRKSSIGKLDKALDLAPANGWFVIDMKNDWKKIYPFDP